MVGFVESDRSFTNHSRQFEEGFWDRRPFGGHSFGGRHVAGAIASHLEVVAAITTDVLVLIIRRPEDNVVTACAADVVTACAAAPADIPTAAATINSF